MEALIVPWSMGVDVHAYCIDRTTKQRELGTIVTYDRDDGGSDGDCADGKGDGGGGGGGHQVTRGGDDVSGTTAGDG